MNNSKQFPLVDVVMAYDGRMFYAGHGLSGMMQVMAYMVGEPVYLHDIRRIADECIPYLLDQHPWLARTKTFVFDKSKGQDDVNRQGREYIASLVAQYGTTLAVRPIPMDDHTSIDPVESLAQLLRDAGRNPEDVMLTLDLSEDDDNDDDSLYGTLPPKERP